VGLVCGDAGGHDGHRIDRKFPAIGFTTSALQPRRWARVRSRHAVASLLGIRERNSLPGDCASGVFEWRSNGQNQRQPALRRPTPDSSNRSWRPRSRVPSGERWLHEIKFDGYRVQLHIANDDIKVFTRRGNDWTKRFKKIASDAYLINAGSAIIDGEVVVPAADGTTDFRCCKTSSRESRTRS
jgi:ATP-dependent DNA ligase